MRYSLTAFSLACACAIAAAEPSARGSGDGRLIWIEGEGFVRDGARKIPLPTLARGASRGIVFAERGSRFCVVDAADQEVGLHLGTEPGPRSAKAVLMRTMLRLVDEGGRVLWSREAPEAYGVGRVSDARLARVADDGTLAVVLQDIEPYAKRRPLLWVIRPGGREALRLDYKAWSKIDELALSPDGNYLAARGFGHIPDRESWERALAIYEVGSERAWTGPDPSPDSPGLLRSVDAAGTACCFKSGKSHLSVDAAGHIRTLSPDEARGRLGEGL